MTTACPHIETNVHERILTITINRPEKKNALTLAMYQAMHEILSQAATDTDIRVVLLQGAAGMFSSGNDLQDFLQHQPEPNSDNPVEQFMQSLMHCPKPVVAAVNGPAVGIGFTLLLHCDLVYVGTDVHLQLPFVNLGLSPEFASSYVLPRLSGYAKAAELLLLAEPINGIQAEQLGIANRCVVDDQVVNTAWAACQKLAAKPPAALRASKALLRAGQQASVDAAIARELPIFYTGLQHDEFREAAAAFFEKRRPDFNRFE